MEGHLRTQDTTSSSPVLTPWQRVQLSRHPQRPHARDYIDSLFPDFLELHGDRAFGEDPALVGGVGTWRISPKIQVPVLILGTQKGRTTKQKTERNFGMVKPEGYRKAIRLMQLAERTRMPVLSFVDTPGAYPGMEAEERGQAQAIAESIQQMFALTVPSLAVVIGEGGSGGALAIACSNQVFMLENSTYSVISPESCASILWSDASRAPQAAEKLKMSAPELLKWKVIDGIIGEPQGGAHTDPAQAASLLSSALHSHWDKALTLWLKGESGARKKSSGTKTALIQQKRFDKFRAMGRSALARSPRSKK